jgi:hypothetical protein
MLLTMPTHAALKGTQQQVWGVFSVNIPWFGKMGLGTYRRGKSESLLPVTLINYLTMPIRYANMDFLVHYTPLGFQLTSLILSYDIACQWSRNLSKRNRQFDQELQFSKALLAVIIFVIPKFHIYAHGPSCQTKFSLNYIRYSGRSNGEDPERWWSHINPASMQTKEMGPGARINTLDDHALRWNWQKIIGFSVSIHPFYIK